MQIVPKSGTIILIVWVKQTSISKATDEESSGHLQTVQQMGYC